MSQCVGRLCRLEATGEPEGLNVAEIELSVLSQQCLARRISSAEEIKGVPKNKMPSRRLRP